MKKYRFSVPTIYDYTTTIEVTEHEIIVLNWVGWSHKVFKNRPDNTFNITVDELIKDFITVNWVEEV